MSTEKELGKLIPGFEGILSKMEPDVRLFTINQYRAKRKSVWIALPLWVIGLHYAYTGKWGLQAIFYLTACGLGIWWLIDLFRLDGITARHNESVALQAAQSAKMLHL